MLTTIGSYVLDDNPPVATAAYIDVLSRVGVSEHAARLTLGRMVERGLLERLRHGRTASFRASEDGLRIARLQHRRTFTGEGRRADDDGWTILSFSMPETRRRERHLLRRRLAWESFGPLRDGVWIAPGHVDLDDLLEALPHAGVDEHVEIFTAYPRFDDVAGMIARTWDLDELAARYQRFLETWSGPDPTPQATDDLGRDLLLVSAWRQLLRATPNLPARHLPVDWPSASCQELFERLHASYAPHADELAAEVFAAHTHRPTPRSD